MDPEILSPLFVAVADATEEAIYDSLLLARTIERETSASGPGYAANALDIERVKAILKRHGVGAARAVLFPIADAV